MSTQIKELENSIMNGRVTNLFFIQALTLHDFGHYIWLLWCIAVLSNLIVLMFYELYDHPINGMYHQDRVVPGLTISECTLA